MPGRHVPRDLLVVGTSAPSHVLPGLALVAALVERGHRVRYAVGAPCAASVAPTGAEVVPLRTVLPPPGGTARWPDDPVAGLALFQDEAEAVLPQLAVRFDGDPPELVLHDLAALAGPPAARRWGVPALCLSPSAVAWEGAAEDMPDHERHMRRSAEGARLHARMTAWLRRHGIHRDPYTAVAYPDRCLALIPRALQPESDRVGPHVRFVGPCLDAERLAARWDPAPRPLAYVALGTAYAGRPDVFRACALGLADRFDVVMATGPSGDAGPPADLPAGVRLHRWVPQLAVLRQAVVFVSHAGMGSAQEALWAGVPVVALPQAVDQFANADRLVSLGVAVRGADPPTPEGIARDVDALLGDPVVPRRVVALRDRIRAEGGVERAADAVEEVAAGAW